MEEFSELMPLLERAPVEEEPIGHSSLTLISEYRQEAEPSPYTAVDDPISAGELIRDGGRALLFDRLKKRRLPVRIESHLPLLPFDGLNQRIAEQYRLLRTRLVQHRNQPRLLLVSSAGPGDGKSITAINTAGALALKQSVKVLLIDSDLWQSSIHRNLELPPGPGLAEVLKGQIGLEDAVIAVEQFRNLWVLTAGDCEANFTELLGSPKWQSLISDVKNTFDYVVFDSPPVGATADYYILEAACDGVILVTRPDYTNRKLCFKTFDTVPRNKLIGVVMNWVDKWSLARYSGYDSYEYLRKNNSRRTAH